MQELEKILYELEKRIFTAEVYNDDFDGTTITNLICLGDVRDILEKHMNDGWIPVERGLPEKAGTYIINVLDGKRDMVTFAKWQNRYKRFDMKGARAYWRIIAWRPLPEPYRPERSRLNET